MVQLLRGFAYRVSVLRAQGNTLGGFQRCGFASQAFPSIPVLGLETTTSELEVMLLVYFVDFHGLKRSNASIVGIAFGRIGTRCISSTFQRASGIFDTEITSEIARQQLRKVVPTVQAEACAEALFST